MYGVINKQRILGELFEKHSEICEVYSKPDFSLEKDSAEFYILCKDIDNTKVFRNPEELVDILYSVSELFDANSKIYFAHSSSDVMLENTKLIWRKGKWFK